MRLESIASGSLGNCYRLTGGDGSQLLIECGISFKQIQRALKFQLTSVDGCLITHSHNDHCAAVRDIADNGIDVYMSQGTSDEIGINHHRIHGVRAGDICHISGWKVRPFSVEHDTSDPVGFLIEDRQGSRMVFATDTYYIRYKFRGLNLIAVECNYSEDILNQNIRDGLVPYVMKRRLAQSHFSLENVKKFLQANDLSEVDEIWLLHLSDRNANEQEFKREIMALTGKIVRVA